MASDLFTEKNIFLNFPNIQDVYIHVVQNLFFTVWFKLCEMCESISRFNCSIKEVPVEVFDVKKKSYFSTIK